MLRVVQSEDQEASGPILLVLKSLHRESAGPKRDIVTSLIRKMALVVFDKCEKALSTEADLTTAVDKNLTSTIKLMDFFGALLFTESDTSTVGSPFFLLHVWAS